MQDWKMTTIAECSTILGDGLHGTPKYDENGEYAFINGNNLHDGKIVIKPDTKRVGFSEYEKHKKELTDRTVLVSINGTLGNVAVYNGEKVVLGKSACYFNVSNDCDVQFMRYVVSSPRFQQYINSVATGTTIKNVSLKQMREYSFPIPELKEQQRIAKVLHLLDQKIENNQKINDNLEQQAQSFFQELFVNNADPKWTTNTISDLGAVIGGSTPSKSKHEYYTESGIAWITPKDLSINKSKFISHGVNDITELGLKNSSAAIMPEGTVLFSSRAPIGYIAIAAGEVTTNQGFKSVVPKPEIGTPFVYFFLKHNLPVIEGMASGSTFKEVSGSTMKNIPAIIPDVETLARFNDFCTPIFAQQRILEEQSQSLAALRDNLLPKLMSGEIDVSDIQL